MKKNILFILLLTFLMMSALTVSVHADQLANDRWCNIDKYGCWITGDYGDHWYIMFWSEASRKYIMGDQTAPYANVVPYCRDCKTGRLPLDPAPFAPPPAPAPEKKCPDKKAAGIEPVLYEAPAPVKRGPSAKAIKIVPTILDELPVTAK